MRKIKFELKDKSRANTLWLKLEYMSGDADAYEYEEINLGIPYSEWKNNLDKIEKEIKDYELIGKFTDINDGLCISHPRYNRKDDIGDPYEWVKENYSEELANMYDNVPGDSTVDHQWKAHLSDITLIGYDEQGNKYESYT